jgi:hypothetical protein
MAMETSLFKRVPIERSDPSWHALDTRIAKVEEVTTAIVFPGAPGSRTPKSLCINMIGQLRSGSISNAGLEDKKHGDA